jgi:cytidine deaminase
MSFAIEELFVEAQNAANFAYAPYSQFRVGAALLGIDGRIFTGCNVENRSFGLTICAERGTVMYAISQGCRSFAAIAIAALDSLAPIPPCGACRQVLSEFMSPDARVYFGGSSSGRVDTTIGALYPFDSLHDLAVQ